MEQIPPLRVVLASTSPYRRELLARLRIPFEIIAPEVDEVPLADESAQATAIRLAALKAATVAEHFRAHLIIGSDQVAECNGKRLDKPLRHEAAVDQLLQASGRTAVFYTAVVLLDTSSGHRQTDVIPTRVRFRKLGRDEIERYLAKEPAYDCAGSAKSEGLGIALLDSLQGSDPTALIGLPLISLSRMLRKAGLLVP